MTAPNPKGSPRRKHLVFIYHTASGRPVYLCSEGKRWVADPERPKGHVRHTPDVDDMCVSLATLVKARGMAGRRQRTLTKK